MNYQGDYFEDSTVYVDFTTNDAAGGAVDPSDPFEAADIKIYKDGSDAQKTTSNGITMVSSFDGITGLHQVIIDTSINTGDAGFWVVGSDYKVVLEPDETVDSQVIVSVPATFSIENRNQRGTDSANTVVPPTAVENRQEMDSNSTQLADILADTNETQGKLPSGTISDFDETTDGVFTPGTKNVLDDLNDISSSDIAAIFAGLLDSGVLVSGITIVDDDPIEVTRGDTKLVTINLGSQWPLTDKLVYFIIKKNQTDANSTAIVNRLADIIDAPNGIAQILLTADEMAVVDCYHYEVELRRDPEDDQPETPKQGMWKINQDTRQ